MNPDLEFFLEKAFDSIEPTFAHIGRVVIEPDYDIDPDEKDQARVAEELVTWLASQRHLGDFAPPKELVTLSKYVRKITLDEHRLEGAWVEVAPPGNWI